MRIALFFNLPSGGAKRAVYEWTRRLAKGHEIDVYTLSCAEHDFCDIRSSVQSYKVFDFTPHYLFESPFGRLNQLQYWRDLGLLTNLHQHIADDINSSNYNAVLANASMYTFIPIFLHYVQIPATYYLHEPFGRAINRNLSRTYQRKNRVRGFLDRYDPLIKLYKRRLDSLQVDSIYAADCLLANSAFTKASMKTAYGVDVPICRYGVNPDEFEPMQSISKGSHLLSVGELSPRKGYDFLIDSLGYIPAAQRPKLRIACNHVLPQEKEYIKKLANEKGVVLEILTKLDAARLKIEYNNAAFCVYAPVLEPFGLVPLESMACGTPVVGVREGGIAESIVHEQTGLLVDRNPAAFANAVQYLLSNPALRAEYGRNGREHVLKNWTWDASSAKLEGYLSEYAAVKV